MRVTKDGKIVKNANVIFSGMSGEPSKVEVDGQVFSASLFEFKDGETKKQTKPASRKRNDTIMTTADVKRKK